MRNRFNEQLNDLSNALIVMGALCEEAIASTAKLLLTNDAETKEAVIEAEKQIDQKERDIEAICMKLLIQQQPIASDLRTVSAALKMISDMERIGDQASDIAEMASYVTTTGLQSETHISEMAQAAMKMVTGSVDAFVKKDAQLAQTVILQDDVVDELFNKVKCELMQAIQNKKSNAEALIDLLLIAKYFERIGDHAENIAEWVIYSLTGKH